MGFNKNQPKRTQIQLPLKSQLINLLKQLTKKLNYFENFSFLKNMRKFELTPVDRKETESVVAAVPAVNTHFFITANYYYDFFYRINVQGNCIADL